MKHFTTEIKATPAVQAIARKAALAGLDLRNGLALLDALHRADALALAGNSIERAAAIAGVRRETFNKHRLRDEGQRESLK